jgi:hypothetical protein
MDGRLVQPTDLEPFGRPKLAAAGPGAQAHGKLLPDLAVPAASRWVCPCPGPGYPSAMGLIRLATRLRDTGVVASVLLATLTVG